MAQVVEILLVEDKDAIYPAVNNMAVDFLATQGARSSTVMALT